MPLAPTPNMLLERPIPGTDDDVWDDLVNAALGLVDSHGHIVGQGVPITSAAININADLQFNSNAATELTGAAFDDLGALLTTGARRIFVFGGDLYFRNDGGANVPITLGNSISQTTVGGIAGDYTAVSAQLAFTDTIDSYTFKQQIGAGVRQWAKIQSADVSLFEYKAHPAAGVPVNSVTLKSPASLVSSYSVTMPAAPPGTQLVLQMGPTGTLVTSNVLTGITSSGIVDFSTASIFRIPQRLLQINPTIGALVAGTATFNGQAVTFTSAGALHVAVNISNGDRINGISITFSRNSGTTLAFAFQEVDMVSGAITTVVSKNISSGVGVQSTQLSVSPTTGALPYTLTNPKTYYVSLGVGNTDAILGIGVLWDRP